MLVSEQTNSSSVKKNSTFMETVQDKLKDIKNFSNWSAKEQIVAVGVMVGALLPFVAVALPFAATGAVVALTLFFAYKAVEYTFKGLKWSAEKTVDGAKYTAGKIKDGAVHAKDKVGEGVDSLKKRFKERDRVVFYNHAKEGAAIEKMTKFPEKDRKKAGEIKHELKAIFADKGDNSKLVKNILSGISLKIDLKIAEEAKSESREHTPKWQVQKDFIKHLGEKDLRVLIKQKALPSDVYFIDRVFSEHYDEIKEVIAKCKEDHILKRSLKMRNNMFEEGSARPSRSFSLPSFSLLGRNNSEQSNSLSKSSSLDFVRTDSTISSEAELLNPAKHKEVKTTAPFKVPLWLGGKKAPGETTNVKYQVLSESDTLSRQVGKSTFYVDTPIPIENTGKTATVGGRLSGKQPIPVTPPKVSRSSSTDSGMGSGSSTPRGQSLSIEELHRGLDEAMKELDLAVSQLPSTEVGENSVHHLAGVKVKMD
ncbi:hypothetical protein [Wolbachia endosymbiont (group A) of Myopa testacea]|uniref:actin-bundling T4SS effector WalE1 family protein n=1 Tax=Wolbachia endosymbiont (group A) of Myopa testacea TaxID=3066148 RepID=UPI00313309BB